MKDLKNYQTDEPMSKDQIGIISFFSGMAFMCILDLAMRAAI